MMDFRESLLIAALVEIFPLIESATFNIDCGFSGQYSGILPLGNYFPLDIVLGHPQNASIHVHSPCCNDVIISRASCSGCSVDGSHVCFSDSEYVSLDYSKSAVRSCKANTTVEIKCINIKCPDHNGTSNAFVSPGEETECLSWGNYVCTNNGTWIPKNCSHARTPLEWTTQTVDLLSSVRSTVPDGGLVTTFFSGNMTWEIIDVSGTTIGVNSNFGENASLYNDTTTDMFDKTKAMKDLRTFLIVLGGVLGFAMVLVCTFFISLEPDETPGNPTSDLVNCLELRKNKKKPTKTVYPLEYWHDREYVDSVMDKGMYSKHPFSVNPIYASDQSKTSSKRFRRNSEQTKNRKLPSSETINTEVPRKMKHDYAENYVATAAGSNFYSYRKSPDIDVTDIDHVLDEFTEMDDKSPSIPRGAKIYPDSTFKPTKGGRKNKRLRDSVGRNSAGDDSGREEHSGNIAAGEEIYAMSYRNKLRNNLNDWSAEESDV